MSVKVESSVTHIDHEESLNDFERKLEKKIKRKIDLRFLVLVIIYLINWIDRNNYAAARLQGLESDLGLKDTQFQVALSILYVGYILFQVPSNLILNLVKRPSWYLAGATVLWGIISACSAASQNFAGILACRFFLGFVEACFLPGSLFYLSKWYTRREIAFRMTMLYSGSLLSGAFGNLIGAGILAGMDGLAGLRAWRWLYIIEGLVTVVIGIAAGFILPDFPENWSRLSPDEKHVAMKRIAKDNSQADVNSKSDQSSLKLAFTDIKTYLTAFLWLGIIAANGFVNYMPTLTKALGYSNFISLLLVAPPYIFMLLYTMFHGWLSDKVQMRFWFIIYPFIPTVVGFFVFGWTETFGARYFSFFLMFFSYCSIVSMFAWAPATCPSPPGKRGVVLAFANCFGNIGNIVSSYFYRAEDAPYYKPAMYINIAFLAVATAAAVALRFVLMKQNRELARIEEDKGVPVSMEQLEKSMAAEGITLEEAKEQAKGFRYLI